MISYCDGTTRPGNATTSDEATPSHIAAVVLTVADPRVDHGIPAL